MLSVVSADENRSIKMVNSGNSNQEQSTLICQGNTETELLMKSQEAIADIDFSLGDQLLYTAYAGGYLTGIIIDNPESNKAYTFEMVASVLTWGSVLTINHKPVKLRQLIKQSLMALLQISPVNLQNAGLPATLAPTTRQRQKMMPPKPPQAGIGNLVVNKATNTTAIPAHPAQPG